MLSDAYMDHLFQYHPPTAKTLPKYGSIREAEALCRQALREIFLTLEGGDRPTEYQPFFEAVTAATRAFAVTLNKEAPECGDKVAAIRCVRLARMAANEAVLRFGCGMVGEGLNLKEVVLLELTKARWWASAAVAVDPEHGK